MEEIINVNEKIKFKNKVKSFFDKVFETPKSTVTFLFLLLSSIMGVYFLYIYLANNNFYNNWSDDSLQYYPIMCDFVDSIKSGTFSLYSFKNYLGASFFSDTYYIPLDGFTLIILLMSFVMNTEVAMSIVEILKLILGACALSAYLGIKGHKTKTIFLVGLFYFSSSGITCFSCFPCFTSLAFYLPFSLIVINYFLKGKWQFVPIYSCILVFYNFYLAYTAFAFMAFSTLSLLILNKEKFLNVIKKTVIFVSLVVLGLLMAMVVFLPSIKFVLSSTSREVAGGGSIKGLIYMFEGYLELGLTVFKSFVDLLVNVLKSKGGIFKNSSIFYDSFLDTRYLYNTLKDTRYFEDVKVMESFFDVKEYYRMLTNTLTPVTPSSFYGYQSSYFIEHISFYITGVGLLFTIYLWFLKDYKSRVYKVILVITTIMMLLPFFSYIYSANLEVLYTRWFNVVTIPLLIIVAHVMDEVGLDNLKPKKLVISFVVIVYMGVLASYNHLYTLTSFGIKNDWDEAILTFENSFYYYVLLIFFIITLMIVCFYFISKFKNKKTRTVLWIVVPIIFVFFIGLVGLEIIDAFNLVPSDLVDLSGSLFVTNDIDNEFFDANEQIAFQYLIFLTLILVLLAVYALIKKNKVILGIIIALEFVFSACLSFGTCVIYSGREGTFENTHTMSEFISENIDEDDLYRIYIDTSCGDYLKTNTARFMPTGVNSDIFHSFIYAGTDDVAGLIFDKKDEGQAGKYALNTYSYYLNVLLGYKYVLASTDSSFSSYDSNQFELIKEDEELGLMLLMFKDYEKLIVYDKYLSVDQFENVSSSLKSVSIEKTMIENVIINTEYLSVLEKYNFNNVDENTLKNISSSKTYSQKVSFSSNNSKVVQIGEDHYYRYDFNGDDEITTRSYAINIFGLEDEIEDLILNDQVYLEYEDGGILYLDSNHIRSMCGSTLHIPVYGGKDRSKTKPKSLYIYAGEDYSLYAPTLRYTVEAIFAPSDSMLNYENGGDMSDDEYPEAAIRFHIDSEITSGTVNFEVSKYSSGSSTLSYNTIYIEYIDGTIVKSSQEVDINKPILNIYIVKSDDISSLYTPPTLKTTSYVKEKNTLDTLSNKEVKVKGRTITVSYTRDMIDTNYSIIMLPTSYSDEWCVVKGNVEDIIPVNGGFIGIIVSNTVRNNEIKIKFRPNGLKTGFLISLVGFIVYGGLVFGTYYIKKKGANKACKL